MKRIVHKLLLLVAVITVTAHGIIPHFHSGHVSLSVQYHDHNLDDYTHTGIHNHDSDDQQNDFSLAQFDENYMPVKWKNISVENSFRFLHTSFPVLHSIKLNTELKINISYYRVFPPPDYYSTNLFSRPPPAC